MMKGNKRKKVLIVDDETFIRQLVHRMLSKDFEVLEACNGAEAVNLTRRNSPDLILMDLMMPVMDGFAACYEIKNNPKTKNIPVLMLTAVSPSRNKQMAQQVWGANGYLTKPIDSGELLDTISHMLAT
jgi:CheY-like chemotaxis protein